MVDQPMAPIVTKEELKEFTEEKYKANPEPYNRLLAEIAKTGINPYTWKEIKRLVSYKVETILREFYTKNLDIETKEIFQEKLKSILEPLSHFIETYIFPYFSNLKKRTIHFTENLRIGAKPTKTL